MSSKWHPNVIQMSSISLKRHSNEMSYKCNLNVLFTRYDGAPKPANYEALELLQSECPHLYDELTATGEVVLFAQL